LPEQSLSNLFTDPLKRDDAELKWMLVGLAVLELGGAALVTVIGHGGWVLVLVTYVGGGALMGVAVLRLKRRDYSVAAVLLFMFTILAFSVWNFCVLGVSVWSRWTGIGGWTFALLELISAIPLIVSAWLLHLKLYPRT
jgi:cell division protein FtsW (lipid II flippase)